MEENKVKSNLTPVAIIIAGLIIAGAIVGKDSLSKLFENKTDTSETTVAVKGVETETLSASAQFKKYAGDLGLDQAKFDTCLDSGKYQTRISETSNEGTILGINGTPSFFINGKLLIGAQPFSMFKAIIDKELGITTEYPAEIKDTISQMESSGYFSEEVKTVPVADTDPTKGNVNAAITIVEFTDYQCPYCARYAIETLPQIQKEYIDTGKIKYVLKDIPLTSLGHANAEKAAEAALCSGEQGKYWEMHEKLFSSQQEWSELGTN